MPALKDALLSPAILRPAAFLFLWQATPSCGSAFFYFSTAATDAGGLGFDPDFLGKASAVGSVAGLAGVGLYNALYKEAALSSVILWTSVASAALGLAPLALISHANRDWGIDDRVFSLGDDVRKHFFFLTAQATTALLLLLCSSFLFLFPRLLFFSVFFFTPLK